MPISEVRTGTDFAPTVLEVLIARYVRLFRGDPHQDTGYWLFTVW